MKYISPAVEAYFESERYKLALFVSMDIGSTQLRYTSWSLPVLYNSKVYEPRGMDFENANYSTGRIVDEATFTLDDTDRVIYSALYGYVPDESEVKLRLVVLDELDKPVIDPFVLFLGFLDRWDYSPGKISISATSIFSQWMKSPSEVFSGSCRYKEFKGPLCNYSGTGAVYCDRTYDTCKMLGNTANYGGFRFLPSKVNKLLTAK